MAKWAEVPLGSGRLKRELLIWKLWDEAHLPEYGSKWAACFDLKASLRRGDKVKVYGQQNHSANRNIDDCESFVLYSGERALVPTGLIFDLDKDASLRIHPRSGLSLKNGIVVANCEGIVDADYVNQTYIMLHNISDELFHIKNGDRIAQGEVVKSEQVEFVIADREPESKTDREGGFGSTGV
tara:strand:- start:30079 stop:30627 length:549 start_codon:yes stop_codon:yes gene_type:complete